MLTSDCAVAVLMHVINLKLNIFVLPSVEVFVPFGSLSFTACTICLLIYSFCTAFVVHI